MGAIKFSETGRLVFNFYRSYFDVFNSLDSDKDKLEFIKALFNRQFLGIEPTNLSKMANFAYISQKHNIDAQVKGFEDKIGLKLTEIKASVGGSVGGSGQSQSQPPSEPQTKLEIGINYTFEDFWNLYDKKVGDKSKLVKKWENLSDNDREQIMQHIPKYKLAQPDKQYRKNAETYFNNKGWKDEIITPKLPFLPAKPERPKYDPNDPKNQW